MSFFHTNAVSAQRQQILSRVSSLRFEPTTNDSDNAPPPQETANRGNNILFSPLRYKPTLNHSSYHATARANDNVKSSSSSTEAERLTPTTVSIEGVTQKLSSTHLHRKTTPHSFPEPGEFLGKLGARTPAKVTVGKENNLSNLTKHSMVHNFHRDTKKRRFSNASGGWISSYRSTPISKRLFRGSAVGKSTTKERQSLGGIYDYQLDRLAMKTCDRYKLSPTKNGVEEASDVLNENEERLCEIPFFSPIQCNPSIGLQNEQKHDECNDDDDTLLTPVEIDFDENSYHDLFAVRNVKMTDDMEESSNVDSDNAVFDDDEAPFAAFARQYFKD
jgi:hypothetical protein